MSRLTTVAAALCAAFALPAAQAVPASPTPGVASNIDHALAAEFAPNGPGATVIVVKDGKTVLRKAYGLANVAKKTPLAPDTTMRLGSVTKQFTATSVLMLAEEGKLKLSDPITAYLPDYPTHGKTITIEHLLTHTSGIVSYTGKPGFMARMTQDYTVDGMIATFKDDPLEFDPGSSYRYNNSGYFLLGAIIEKVSGMPYHEFVAKRIFVPLGMTHTAYEGHERTRGQQAIGYTRKPDGFEPSAALSMTQPYAAGALVSTVDDLARWDAAVSSGKLLKAADWQRAFTPYTLNNGGSTHYGYGWEIGTLQGMPMISHGGGINGFNTYVLRLPAEHVYVAVLSNTESGLPSAEQAAYEAAALAAGKPFAQHQAISLPAAVLDAYPGEYRIDAKAIRRIRRDGDHLTLQQPGSPPRPVQAFSENGFFIPGTLDWFEFTRDAQGRATQLTMHYPDGPHVFPRTGDAEPQRVAVKLDQARFDALAGRYQFAPFVLEVTRDGDRFFAQATGQPKLEVFASNDHTLFTNEIDAELRFDDAVPGQLVLSQAGREIKGTRLP